MPDRNGNNAWLNTSSYVWTDRTWYLWLVTHGQTNRRRYNMWVGEGVGGAVQS
jgi:hypothetical protein